jgi:hypothetical protein
MARAYCLMREKLATMKQCKKLKKEHRKYQVKTLSPVEEAYLDTIKTAQKKVKKAKGESQDE